VTFPLYLVAHLVYGALMAALFLPRMRVEGDVVGIPLVATLAPVGVLTAPLGAVLLRYTGGWFLHGVMIGDGSIEYERFHLGLMVLLGLLAGACTVGGMFYGIAVLSREKPKLAMLPYGLGVVVLVLVLALDAKDVIVVAGTSGRSLFLHPAGLVSLAIVSVLAASYLYARARLSEPEATGPGSLVRP
jgi:hypothetical protein